MPCFIPMFNTQVLSNNQYNNYVKKNNNNINYLQSYNMNYNKAVMPMSFKKGRSCGSCSGFKKLH